MTSVNPHVALEEESTPRVAERYMAHVAALRTTRGRMHLWHLACARGLYSVLADRIVAGDETPGVPMGCPHELTITPTEFASMLRSVLHAEVRRG